MLKASKKQPKDYKRACAFKFTVSDEQTWTQYTQVDPFFVKRFFEIVSNEINDEGQLIKTVSFKGRSIGKRGQRRLGGLVKIAEEHGLNITIECLHPRSAKTSAVLEKRDVNILPEFELEETAKLIKTDYAVQEMVTYNNSDSIRQSFDIADYFWKPEISAGKHHSCSLFEHHLTNSISIAKNFLKVTVSVKERLRKKLNGILAVKELEARTSDNKFIFYTYRGLKIHSLINEFGCHISEGLNEDILLSISRCLFNGESLFIELANVSQKQVLSDSRNSHPFETFESANRFIQGLKRYVSFFCSLRSNYNENRKNFKKYVKEINYIKNSQYYSKSNVQKRDAILEECLQIFYVWKEKWVSSLRFMGWGRYLKVFISGGSIVFLIDSHPDIYTIQFAQKISPNKNGESEINLLSEGDNDHTDEVVSLYSAVSKDIVK